MDLVVHVDLLELAREMMVGHAEANHVGFVAAVHAVDVVGLHVEHHVAAHAA